MNDSTTAFRFEDLPVERLQSMAAAGDEVRECYRVLEKTDANVVGEILKGQGTFYEWDHYPEGDVFDAETDSQYYYHAHRGATGEHGHFHLFLRPDGMPKGISPMPWETTEEWPAKDDMIAHLGAISMEKSGYPTHLFTTNRWVTGETWYTADDIVAMLDHYKMDHAYPSWPTNRWITAMVALFQPQLAILMRKRDRAIADWRAKHDGDVLEDRDLEITSIMPINVNHQIKQVARALKRLAA
ncbi:MAG: hypothetical protein RIM84_17605 [Alphaproteobacteria bacterium]